jgi:hypothetical protein
MACEITVSVFPLDFRIRTGTAKPSGFLLHGAVAALALFDDLMANPAVVGTPLGCHEGTFLTLAYCGTNHGNHPLVMNRYAMAVYKLRRGRNKAPGARTEIIKSSNLLCQGQKIAARKRDKALAQIGRSPPGASVKDGMMVSRNERLIFPAFVDMLKRRRQGVAGH